MKTFLVLLLGLFFFAGCNSANTVDHNVSALQRTLIKNKKRWESKGIRDYTFVVQRSCFCPLEEKIQVTVEQKKVIKSMFIPSNTLVPKSRKQKSIEGFFGIIQDAIDRNAYRLEVSYDKTYGYPRVISIDYDQRIADEEMYYTLSHFVPTQGGDISCTEQYKPVCGKVNIQCITVPCEAIEQTFSNKCDLNANPNASYLREGEC